MQPTHNIFSFLSSPPFKQINTSPHHFSPERPNPLSLTIITALTASSSSPYTRLTRSARHGHCLHSCPGPADQPHPLAPQPAPPATNNGAKCAIQFPNDRSRQGMRFLAILCLQVMSICRRLSAALRMEISAFESRVSIVAIRFAVRELDGWNCLPTIASASVSDMV